MSLQNQNRNLNPTPAARLAMNIFNTEYVSQNGGSMDFWDNLSISKKTHCIELAKELLIDAYSDGFMDGYNQEECLVYPRVVAGDNADKYIGDL